MNQTRIDLIDSKTSPAVAAYQKKMDPEYVDELSAVEYDLADGLSEILADMRRDRRHD